MTIDDGTAVHYTALEKGTPIYSSDEVQVGVVREVLDNYREHIFDGIVLEDASGTLRFVDAPEVARTAERAVTLTIDAAVVAKLPPPETGPVGLQAARRRQAVAAAGRRLEEAVAPAGPPSSPLRHNRSIRANRAGGTDGAAADPGR